MQAKRVHIIKGSEGQQGPKRGSVDHPRFVCCCLYSGSDCRGRWHEHTSCCRVRPCREPVAVTPTRYGVHLMELLINGLLKQGARRDVLRQRSSVAPRRSRPSRTSANRMPPSPSSSARRRHQGGWVLHGRRPRPQIGFWPVSGREDSIRSRAQKTEDGGAGAASSSCFEAVETSIEFF